MASATQAVPVSKPMLWTGWIMSALPILLVLFGSVVKLMKTASVIEGFVHAGIPEHLIVPVGIIELICVVVYAIPRTAVLGGILMTGLLGGAIIINLRVSDPALPIPIVLALLVWGGLFFREPRMRQLIPLRRPQTGS